MQTQNIDRSNLINSDDLNKVKKKLDKVQILIEVI